MMRAKPFLLIGLFLILSFFLLSISTGTFQGKTMVTGLLFLMAIGGVLLILKGFHFGDSYLFSIIAMLCSIGIVILYRLDPGVGQRQILWFGAGVVAFFAGYLIFVVGYKLWSSPFMMWIYAGASYLLFVLTLAFGERIGGAINWIVIQGVQLQPWEAIKILFVFFLSSYYVRKEFFKSPEITLGSITLKLRHQWLFTASVYLFLLFLILQREWGGSILFFLVFLSMAYAFDGRKIPLLFHTVLAAVAGVGGYYLLPHIRVRVATWINPWTDLDGTGYQITQSLFAIGSGGFFGTGLGLGRPKLIPAVHTDFIFSAICEELGIFGGVGIILLYFLLVYRGFKVVLQQGEPFLRMLAFGITALFGFQTFIIIGGVIKMIPLTGITLPFISYGGSSLITSFLALGVLQAISATGTSFFPLGRKVGDDRG